MCFRAWWLVIGGTLAAAGLARAGNEGLYLPDTVAGARSLAMGNAFRAIGTSNDAIVQNPAGLVLSKRYEVSGFYAMATGAPATYWDAAVCDSVTSPVALGIAYEHLASSSTGTASADGSYTNQRISGGTTRMAFAYALSDTLFMGAAINWYTYNYTSNATLPQGHLSNAVTPDLGLAFRPSEAITLAVVGVHLVNVNNDNFLPRQLAGALAVGTDSTFHLSGDAMVNLTLPKRPIDYHLGGEYLVSSILAVRAGYMFEGIPSANFLSGGIGLIISSFGLDFAISQNLGSSHDHIFALVLKGFLPG